MLPDTFFCILSWRHKRNSSRHGKSLDSFLKSVLVLSEARFPQSELATREKELQVLQDSLADAQRDAKMYAAEIMQFEQDAKSSQLREKSLQKMVSEAEQREADLRNALKKAQMLNQNQEGGGAFSHYNNRNEIGLHSYTSSPAQPRLGSMPLGSDARPYSPSENLVGVGMLVEQHVYEVCAHACVCLSFCRYVSLACVLFHRCQAAVSFCP